MVSTRRTPRQERSRATRDAILEAAARVFAEVGLERATTARIAEVAGVSPGSMYQYFPSKDALISALFTREAEEGFRMFGAIAAELGTTDAPRLIRALVACMVDQLESKLELNRVLLEEVPRVTGLGQSRAVDRVVANAVQLLLEAGKDRMQARDLEIAAMLVVRTFRYNIIPLLSEPVTGKKREAFIDELSELIGVYLLAPRPWRQAE